MPDPEMIARRDTLKREAKCLLYANQQIPDDEDIPLLNLVDSAWMIAEAKGFHDDMPGDRIGTLVRLAFIHTEVSEAIDPIKKRGMDGSEECLRELADVVIRVFDLVGTLDASIAFQKVLREVMLANLERPDKYGTPGQNQG